NWLGNFSDLLGLCLKFNSLRDFLNSLQNFNRLSILRNSAGFRGGCVAVSVQGRNWLRDLRFRDHGHFGLGLRLRLSGLVFALLFLLVLLALLGRKCPGVLS